MSQKKRTVRMVGGLNKPPSNLKKFIVTKTSWMELNAHKMFTYSNFMPYLYDSKWILLIGGGNAGLLRYDIEKDKYELKWAPLPKDIGGYDCCGVSCVNKNDYYLIGGSSYPDGTQLGTNCFVFNFKNKKWSNIQTALSLNNKINFGLYPNIVSDSHDAIHIIGGTSNNIHYKYDNKSQRLQKMFTFKDNIFTGILIYDNIDDRLILIGGKKIEKHRENDNIPGSFRRDIQIGTQKCNKNEWNWTQYNYKGFTALFPTICCYSTGHIFLPFLQTVIIFSNNNDDKIHLLDFKRNKLIISNTLCPTKKIAGSVLVGHDVHLFENPKFWNFDSRRHWKININCILTPYYLKEIKRINTLSVERYIKHVKYPFNVPKGVVCVIGDYLFLH